MISGTGFDSQVFGAQVVSKTLDYMNGSNFSNNSYGMSGMSNTMAFDRSTAESQLVTQTLDNMNAPMGNMSNDYDFQTQVMGAYTMGKGTIADTFI